MLAWKMSLKSMEFCSHGKSMEKHGINLHASMEKFHAFSLQISMEIIHASMENIHEIHGILLAWTTMDSMDFSWKFAMKYPWNFHGFTMLLVPGSWESVSVHEKVWKYISRCGNANFKNLGQRTVKIPNLASSLILLWSMKSMKLIYKAKKRTVSKSYFNEIRDTEESMKLMSKKWKDR